MHVESGFYTGVEIVARPCANNVTEFLIIFVTVVKSKALITVSKWVAHWAEFARGKSKRK